MVSVKLSEAFPQSGVICYLLKELNTFQGSAQLVEACPTCTKPILSLHQSQMVTHACDLSTEGGGKRVQNIRSPLPYGELETSLGYMRSSLINKQINTYLNLYLGWMHTLALMKGSEGNCWNSVRSFLHMGSGNQMQVVACNRLFPESPHRPIDKEKPILLSTETLYLDAYNVFTRNCQIPMFSR